MIRKEHLSDHPDGRDEEQDGAMGDDHPRAKVLDVEGRGVHKGMTSVKRGRWQDSGSLSLQAACYAAISCPMAQVDLTHKTGPTHHADPIGITS